MIDHTTAAPQDAPPAAPEPVVDRFREPTPYEQAILLGLQRRGRHVYAGTVPPGEVQYRRRRNRAARRSRQINRKANR